MASIQGEITSHAPSATLIHSSHGRNSESVTTSARMIRKPTITALRVGTGSRSNSSAHGEMHSQMPKAQLAQSSHCFGSVSATRVGISDRDDASSNRHPAPFFLEHDLIRKPVP